MSFVYSHPFTGLANGLNTINAAGGGAGGIGGWVELGRTTLGSAGDTITVSSLPDKRYYMVLTDYQASGDIFALRRLNNDSGSNYAFRYSKNGAADSTGTSQTKILNAAGGYTTNGFAVSYLANLSSNEKLHIGHYINQNTAGAGNAPIREETVGKWANTSNAINRIDEVNTSSGDYASGSECVVLGWDPADTHTNNFWEELASVEWSSGGTIDTGAFTAKKYLWVQLYFKGNSGVYSRFNSDSGSNYAWRFSHNGGSDGTITSTTGFLSNFGFGSQPNFMNMFIINNSANEKLVISHINYQSTAGAGNVPSRSEQVHKWANTSSQITSIQLVTAAGNFTGGQIKVWGAN